MKSRGAQLYVITDNKDLCEGLCDDPIVIPSNGLLTALIAVLPMQVSRPAIFMSIVLLPAAML